MQMTVSTKEELRRAYKAKVDTIVVVGELAEMMKKVEPLGKVKPITYGGLSLLAGVKAMGGPLSSVAVASIAALTGLEIGIIIIATSIGLSFVISVFKDYETDASVKFDVNGVQCRLKRKR